MFFIYCFLFFFTHFLAFCKAKCTTHLELNCCHRPLSLSHTLWLIFFFPFSVRSGNGAFQLKRMLGLITSSRMKEGWLHSFIFFFFLIYNSLLLGSTVPSLSCEKIKYNFGKNWIKFSLKHKAHATSLLSSFTLIN